VVALICSYRALVLGVRLSQARYSSDVNTLGEDGILPVYRHGQFCVKCSFADCIVDYCFDYTRLTSVTPDGRQFRR